MATLELHAEDRGQTAIVALSGERDISSAVRVEGALSRVQGGETPRRRRGRPIGRY